MQLQDIWVSQRNLRRSTQIPAMIEAIVADTLLPPILLNHCEDGEVQLIDGHHRLAAYYLAGKEVLDPWDYFLVEGNCQRRFGKIDSLIRSIP